MSIKSLEELKKIRETHKKKVKLRESGESSDQTIEVLVGMATCGIAAGSREVLHALIDIINEKDIDNIKVIQVGCMGYCHSEPTVQLNIPGQEPIIYGKVDPSIAEEIVDKHIVGGEILDNHVLIKTFNSAL